MSIKTAATATETAQVFFTTYALYNAGYQFASDISGSWYDVSSFDYSEIESILIRAEQECFSDPTIDSVEMMCTDFEGFPRSLYSESLTESTYDSIKAYAELGDDQKEVVKWLCGDYGYDIEKAIEKSDDVCTTDDIIQYVYELVQEMGVSGFALTYFDFDKFQNDLSFEGSIVEMSNGQWCTNGYEL